MNTTQKKKIVTVCLKRASCVNYKKKEFLLCSQTHVLCITLTLNMSYKKPLNEQFFGCVPIFNMHSGLENEKKKKSCTLCDQVWSRQQHKVFLFVSQNFFFSSAF